MRSYRVKIHLLHFPKTSHLWGINENYWDLCKWIRRVQGQLGGEKCSWKSWWSAGFFNWRAQFQHAILVAHNRRRFDFSALVNAARNFCLLETLLSSLKGCIDSLTMFCNSSPTTRKGVCCIIFFILHIRHMMPWNMLSDNDLLAYYFSPDVVYNNLLFFQAESKNITS